MFFAGPRANWITAQQCVHRKCGIRRHRHFDFRSFRDGHGEAAVLVKRQFSPSPRNCPTLRRKGFSLAATIGPGPAYAQSELRFHTASSLLQSRAMDITNLSPAELRKA